MQDASSLFICLETEAQIREVARFLPEAQKEALRVERKADRSYVTACDLKMESLLRDILSGYALDIWSEETPRVLGFKGTGFIFDPIDGTASFIKGRDEYSVMLAYVEQGEAIWGIVHQPALGLSWIGHPAVGALCLDEDGQEHALRIHDKRREPIRFLVSRDHPDLLVDRIAQDVQAEAVPLSSTGLKMMAILEGQGDVYMNLSGRLGPWDIAPPMVIFELAGGTVASSDRELLDFRSPWTESPPIICGNRAHIITLSELEFI